MSVETLDVYKIWRVALNQAVFITRLCVIMMSGLILAGRFMPVVDNKDVKRAKKTPHIAYQQLTTEASHPVLFQTPERIEAIKTYPTTRACLIESERTSENPDLRLIDWKYIRKRAHFYWHKDKGLPFRDEVPVPRIFLGSFVISIHFQQSDSRPKFVTAEWQQTM